MSQAKRRVPKHAMQRVFEESERIVDAPTVRRAIDQVAVRISVDLADSDPLAMCVMTGGLIFAGELITRLRFPLELDYLHATRYRARTEGSQLHWVVEPAADVNGRTVLVIDDVLDHGHTLAAVVAALRGRGARDVRTVVLVDKALASPKPIAADYVALVCPDRYLFGCGMDYKNYWRNLPEIYAVPAHLLTE